MSEMMKLLEAVEKEIESLKEGDAYRGFHSESQGQKLEEQLRFYKYGVLREVPKEWNAIAQKLDDEYLEYLRLKEKFEEE